jgi:hypothetical protein
MEQLNRRAITYGFLSRENPNMHAGLSGNTFYRNQDLPDEATVRRWPVPMSYVENLWTEEFWEHFIRKYGDLRKYGSAIARGQELRAGPFVEGRATKVRAGEANSWPRYPVTSGFDALSEIRWYRIFSKKPSSALIGAYTVEAGRINGRHAARSALQTVRDKLLEVDVSMLQKKVSNFQIDQPNISAPTSQHGDPEASDLGSPLSTDDDDNDSNSAYEGLQTVDPIQTFADIHLIMCENHDRLALATMRNEIGDYLLLKYVNDIQQQRDIGWEEFYQYLNYMTRVRYECF